MNILFTSAGRRGYLLNYFREALDGMCEIHAANSSDYAPAFLQADKTVITPLIHSAGYIDFILNYCEKENISVVIPLFDIDIPVLAQANQRFVDAGIKLIASSVSIAQICNDKLKTQHFLHSHGFTSPSTFSSLVEVREALSRKGINFPLVIKPRWGMGSIGLQIAENELELDVLYNKVQREIERSYLKYESALDISHSVIIQEKLSGEEYGLDIINDLDGNHVATIVKKKLAMRAGETDMAITVDDARLAKIGLELGKITGHVGNLDVDVFKDGDRVYILELNARFGGGYPFSHLAGANVPRAIIAWLKNEPVKLEWLTVQPGVIGVKDIEVKRIFT